ncbi:glycosyltransferase [Sulfurovum sp.]|uniref:glycosyltransferase n=1 Tax=Sulfurovum sp. TaxID=1969726 RepID=UPI002A361E01|nr:glycosyltransferase [Sulfurovum sp.]MDY0402701.1 glycosyltransferase [Sulfurovum sp.]
MNFSVLMSIYHKEKPEYFNRAMQSIWDEQTIKPNEIVLVQDGPLTKELHIEIDKWKVKIGESFQTVPLEKNVGLGGALNIGIQNCTYELIARMDTDDIACPGRFKKQLEVFHSDQELGVCGSCIGEFSEDENSVSSFRIVPEDTKAIYTFAKKRNPMNHPSVMFKKDIVVKLGGYGNYYFAQDYHLWVKLLLNDVKFYNIQEVLVLMRAGESQTKRRSGYKYAMNEFKIYKSFYEQNFLNFFEFFAAVFLRMTIRLLPVNLVVFVYRVLRYNKSQQGELGECKFK